MSWIIECTYCTHNSPTRFWETGVLDPICGRVATSHSDSEEGSKQLARLIAAAPDLLQALKEAEKAEGVLINEWADFWDVAPQTLIDALMKAQSARNAAISKAEGAQ